MGGGGKPAGPGMGGGFETAFYQAVIDLLQHRLQ
jgi:hypothetical protein